MLAITIPLYVALSILITLGLRLTAGYYEKKYQIDCEELLETSEQLNFIRRTNQYAPFRVK